MSAPFQFLMLGMFCIVPYVCVIAWRLKQRSVGGPTWYESIFCSRSREDSVSGDCRRAIVLSLGCGAVLGGTSHDEKSALNRERPRPTHQTPEIRRNRTRSAYAGYPGSFSQRIRSSCAVLRISRATYPAAGSSDQ